MALPIAGDAVGILTITDARLGNLRCRRYGIMRFETIAQEDFQIPSEHLCDGCGYEPVFSEQAKCEVVCQNGSV